nr:transcription factor bHLH62-like [Tanacetum cinerariifolium]
MSKDGFFNTLQQPWNSMFAMELDSQVNEMNLFSHNWENSMDQSDPFESALSSIVSSPVNNSHPGTGIMTPVQGCHAGTGAESVVLKELIGRLGNICNSGEISPESCIHGNNSTNTSCYTTPLNSPPKLNLSINHRINHHQLPMIPNDPGFVERAARFSCFGGAKEGEFSQHMVESGKMSRVSSISRLSMNLNSENKETCFFSHLIPLSQIPPQLWRNLRKRNQMRKEASQRKKGME